MRRTVSLAGAFAVGALVACGSEDRRTERSAEERAADALRPGAQRLASVKLDDGREVVLQSLLLRKQISRRRYLAEHPETLTRLPRAVVTPPCLILLGIDRFRRTCITPTIKGRQILAGPIVRKHRSAPMEVHGLTSAEVTRVYVDYEEAGTSGGKAAVLLRVIDADILARAGIARPFGYFFAELPSDVSSVRAIARGAGGRRLGAASFDRSLRAAFPKGLRAYIEGQVKLPASDHRAGGPAGR